MAIVASPPSRPVNEGGYPHLWLPSGQNSGQSRFAGMKREGSSNGQAGQNEFRSAFVPGGLTEASWTLWRVPETLSRA